MAGSGTAHLRPADQTLLRVEDLVVEFPVGRTGLKVHAVTNVSIDVLIGDATCDISSRAFFLSSAGITYHGDSSVLVADMACS